MSEKSVQDSEPTKYHPEAIKCPARQEDPTTESQDKECLSQIESFPEGDKGETEK